MIAFTKLAEIWRKALEELRSGNNTGGKNSFREDFDTHKVSESKKTTIMYPYHHFMLGLTVFSPMGAT